MVERVVEHGKLHLAVADAGAWETAVCVGIC